MVNIKFDFDPKKLHRDVEKMAEKSYFEAVERARKSLGADRRLVKVTRFSSPHRQGSNLTFGDVSFPDEDIKRRFEEALRRELK
jgi:hypothetical protein